MKAPLAANLKSQPPRRPCDSAHHETFAQGTNGFFASCELFFAVRAKRFTRDRAQPDAIRHTLMSWKIRFACGAPTTTPPPTHHPVKDRQSLLSFALHRCVRRIERCDAFEYGFSEGAGVTKNGTGLRDVPRGYLQVLKVFYSPLMLGRVWIHHRHRLLAFGEVAAHQVG